MSPTLSAVVSPLGAAPGVFVTADPSGRHVLLRRSGGALTVHDTHVQQRGTTVEVFTKEPLGALTLDEIHDAIDRIIAAPDVPLEPRVALHISGEDHPLAFVPASGKLALYLLEQPFGTFRTCTYEVQLESPVTDVHVTFVPPPTDSPYPVSALHADYTMVTPDAMEAELRLAEVMYSCGAQGLELEGHTARFVFEVTNISRTAADVDLMVGSGAYDDCAELVLGQANPDLIGRAMFPRLAALVTTRG